VAIVKNNPYPEIGDYFGQYRNWKPITLPSGEVVYEIPGHPERVFVPSLSNASGRPVLRPNPSAEIAKQQEAEDAQKKAQKQQERANSPLGQATPVIAGTGGVLVANEIMKGGFGNPPPKLSFVDTKTGTQFFDDGSKIMADGTKVPPPTGAITPSQAAAQGATSAPTVAAGGSSAHIAELPGGGTAMPDGSVVNGSTVQMPDGTTANVETGQVADANGSPISGTQAAQILQGAMAIYEGYTAYQKWKSGDRTGAAISGTSAGLTGAGALGYGTAGAAGAVLGYYGPSYAKYAQNLMKDPEEDDYFKAALLSNLVTAWAVPIMDAAGIGVKAGKHIDQKKRDLVRDFLYDNKITTVEDGHHYITLADGTKYDIGKDGHDRPYNVDFSREGIGGVVADLNPLGAIVGGGDQKLTDDFTGYYTNAATSSGDVNQNIRKLYADHGIKTAEQASSVIDQLVADKRLDPEKAAIYKNSLGRVFSGSGSTFTGTKPPANQQAPQTPQTPQQPQTPGTAAAQGAKEPMKITDIPANQKPATFSSSAPTLPTQQYKPLAMPNATGGGMQIDQPTAPMLGKTGKPLHVVYDETGKGSYVDPDGGPVPQVLFFKPGSPAAQQAIGGMQAIGGQPMTPAEAAAQGAMRSSTKSPGIDLSGRRIPVVNYR